MKISGLIRRIVACFVIVLAVRGDGAAGKVDHKTKLLLRNIRNHLEAKHADVVEVKACDPRVTLCGVRLDSNESEELLVSSSAGNFPKEQEKIHPVKSGTGLGGPTQKQKVSKDESNRKIDDKGISQKRSKTLKYGHFFRHLPIADVETKDSEENEVKTTNKKEDKIDGIVKPAKLFRKVFVAKKVGERDDKTKVNKDGSQAMEKLKMSKNKMSEQESKRKTMIESDESDDERGKVKVKRIKRKKTEDITLDEKEIEKPGVRYNVKSQRSKKASESRKKLKTTATIEEEEEMDEVIFQPDSFFFTTKPNEGDADADETCKKHKNIYLKQLKKYKMWALMMFDATAKLPSGILQGNLNQYGDFDECLSINAVFKKPNLDEPSGIKGKYCLANFDLTTDSTESSSVHQALERVQSFSFVKSTVHDPSHFIPRFTSISWGLCVPDACPAKDIEKLIGHQLRKLNGSNDVQITVNVAEENCVVKRDLSFELTETVLGVLGFYLVIVVAAFYATYVDVKKLNTSKSQLSEAEKSVRELEEASKDADVAADKKTPKNDFYRESKGYFERTIMAFSLKKNIKKLIEDEREDSIQCINGIKALFSVMLFLAHKTIPLGWTAFSNRVLLTKVSNEPGTTILRTSIIYTDSFLLMSGLLTAYNLSEEMLSKGRIQWVRRLAVRYIRLTPALLAILLFYAYLWNHTGSGPLWNTLVKRNSKLCQEHMWRNLLYIQNLFPFEYMCAPQTHQLALDMQLSALAPFFVYLLHKYDKVGVGILQALFLQSSIVRYLATSKNDLSVIVYHGMPVAQLYRTADKLYTQTLHRASPYLMGAIVGHYLQMLKDRRLNIPNVLVAFGWMAAFACALYSITSPYNMAARDYEYNVAEAAQYAALSPVAWSFFLAWIIIACHLGFGGRINHFLCNKILLVFSRISYCFYLTQFLVFFYKVGVKRVPEMFTFTGSIDINEFGTVVFISTIVTLLFDIPMTEIKKIILDKSTIKTIGNVVEEPIVSNKPNDSSANEISEENSILEPVNEVLHEEKVEEDRVEDLEKYVRDEEEEEECVVREEMGSDIEVENAEDVTEEDVSFEGESTGNVEEGEDADVEEEETDEKVEDTPPRRFFFDDVDPDWLKDD